MCLCGVYSSVTCLCHVLRVFATCLYVSWWFQWRYQASAACWCPASGRPRPRQPGNYRQRSPSAAMEYAGPAQWKHAMSFILIYLQKQTELFPCAVETTIQLGSQNSDVVTSSKILKQTLDTLDTNLPYNRAKRTIVYVYARIIRTYNAGHSQWNQAMSFISIYLQKQTTVFNLYQTKIRDLPITVNRHFTSRWIWRCFRKYHSRSKNNIYWKSR